MRNYDDEYFCRKCLIGKETRHLGTSGLCRMFCHICHQLIINGILYCFRKWNCLKGGLSERIFPSIRGLLLNLIAANPTKLFILFFTIRLNEGHRFSWLYYPWELFVCKSIKNKVPSIKYLQYHDIYSVLSKSKSVKFHW